MTSNTGKRSSRNYGRDRAGLPMSKEIVAGGTNQSEARILMIGGFPWTCVAEEMGVKERG